MQNNQQSDAVTIGNCFVETLLDQYYFLKRYYHVYNPTIPYYKLNYASLRSYDSVLFIDLKQRVILVLYKCFSNQALCSLLILFCGLINMYFLAL